MFGFLEAIDHGLYERYQTVERNIRAGSNSFYDAYLALLEQFVRLLLTEADLMPEGQATCGAMLRRGEVRECFLSFGVSDYIYGKLQDYTLKVNAHKHKGEKTAGIETVISYMRVFHSAAAAYATHKGLSVSHFDDGCYADMLGSFERENADLKGEILGRMERIEAAEERARRDREEILMEIRAAREGAPQAAAVPQRSPTVVEFARNADQEHLWLGTEEMFSKEKRRAARTVAVAMIGLLVATVFTTLGIGYYTTFSLFENIWLFCLLFVLSHTKRAERHYPLVRYAERSLDRFEVGKDGIARPTRRKRRYRWFFVFSCVGALLNAFLLFSNGGFLSVLAAVIELSVAGICMVASNRVWGFFTLYSAIRLAPRDGAYPEIGPLIYDVVSGKLFKEKDYYEKNSFMK